jgi:hypothetical protein
VQEEVLMQVWGVEGDVNILYTDSLNDTGINLRKKVQLDNKEGVRLYGYTKEMAEICHFRPKAVFSYGHR